MRLWLLLCCLVEVLSSFSARADNGVGPDSGPIGGAVIDSAVDAVFGKSDDDTSDSGDDGD